MPSGPKTKLGASRLFVTLNNVMRSRGQRAVRVVFHDSKDLPSCRKTKLGASPFDDCKESPSGRKTKLGESPFHDSKERQAV
jgi:hypothetical protein